MLSLVLLSLAAQGVPLRLDHNGRLFDAGGAPIQGAQSITFTLYESGSAVWTETSSVTFDQGYFHAVLGADTLSNPLDTAMLDSGVLEVGVDIGGSEVRQDVHSVPYAVVAGTATNVSGGVVDASEVRIGGSLVIDDSGSFLGDVGNDTLGGLTCNTDQVPLFNGTDWVCSDPSGADWNTLTSIPLELLDGDDDTLAGQPCSDGEIVVFDASDGDWDCAADQILSESEVEGFITNGPLTLAPGSAVGADPLVTDWSNLPGIPTDLADGTIAWSELVGIPSDLSDGGIAWSELSGIPTDLSDGTITWGEIGGIPADLSDGTIAWTEISGVPGDLLDGDDVFSGSWGDLTGIPAGFLDGTDDDTIYTDLQAISAVGGQALASFIGSVQVGTDSTACDSARYGTMRWTGTALEICGVGDAWEVVQATVGPPAASGQDAGSAGTSCRQILDDYPASIDNYYWRDAGGGPFEVWCDMTSDGGGWTLVAAVAFNNANHTSSTGEVNADTPVRPVPYETEPGGRKLADNAVIALAVEGTIRVQVDDRDAPTYTNFFRFPAGFGDLDFTCGGTACPRMITSHSFPYVWESSPCTGTSVGYRVANGSYRVFDNHDDAECGSRWESTEYSIGHRVLYSYDPTSNLGLYNGKRGWTWVR